MKLQPPNVTLLTCEGAPVRETFLRVCGFAALRFDAVRAKVGARPHLRMQTAGAEPLVIHLAKAGLGIQQLAIAAGPSGQT